ncbi:MAG TPA: DUF624 domain-containing protein [Clostridiales bacterium]|nr:DUF624 domain-containing protein [Clostridiales bacterium]
MGNLFSLDNGFFSFLSKVCDIIFLSIIFVIFCIPVITIGPACTALYYATVKVIRRERGYVFREFFRSFKLNFKKGAIVGILLTIVYIIVGFDLWAAYRALDGSTLRFAMFGVYLAIAILALGFSVYVYPVLSRFDVSLRQLIKTVLIISLRHLPSTVCMIILTGAAVLGVYIIPFLLFVIPGVLVLLNSLLMEKILKKYTPQPEGGSEDESKKDEWYLE